MDRVAVGGADFLVVTADVSPPVAIYADDTLLVGGLGPCLTNLLAAVAKVGSRYGMELHYDKFQLLQVRCNFSVQGPGGEAIQTEESINYLGSFLYADGTIKNELGRRLGMA